MEGKGYNEKSVIVLKNEITLPWARKLFQMCESQYEKNHTGKRVRILITVYS